MLKYSFLVLTLILFAASCKRIETGDSLSRKDYQRFRSLHLIENGERLYKFYSEFKKSVAGNFYTDRRMASYWIDERDSTKNSTEFAYYEDIIRIDTCYNAGLTYAPFMLVTRKDSTQFKVCVEGSKQEIADFFNDAISKWQLRKNMHE
jgi:hypothetical protein